MEPYNGHFPSFTLLFWGEVLEDINVSRKGTQTPIWVAG